MAGDKGVRAEDGWQEPSVVTINLGAGLGAGRWALGAGTLDRWIAGSLDRWIAGPLDRWTAGPLDRWTAGPLDRWDAGSL